MRLLPRSSLSGISINGYNTDFEDKTRGTTPRMGALEGYIWKGTINSDYNNAGNWNCNKVPEDGATIIFDNSPNNNCILDNDKIVGSVINSQPTYLLDINGHNLTLSGDICLSNGAKIKADALNSSITFQSGIVQSISSNCFFNNNVYSLNISNNSQVLSNTDFKIINNLNLNAGFLNLNSTKLYIGENATITTSKSSSAMITTSGTGMLYKIFTSYGSFTFPLGAVNTNSIYSPVTITLTNGTLVTNAAIGAAVQGVKHPDNHSTADYLNRYWTFDSENITGFTLNATMEYSTSDVVGSENNLYAAIYNNGIWENYTPANISNHTLNYSGISTLGVISGGQDGVMPIKLNAFNSNVSGSNVKLNWITSSEINNHGFEIERSSDTIKMWSKIDFVKGSGTKNTPTAYTYEDKKLKCGKYNYRLKQIDNNGNYEYFNLNSSVVVSIPKKFNISQNYPNPFNPNTKIDFEIPKETFITIKIYNSIGQEVKTLVSQNYTEGYYTLNVNASDLSSGIYYYHFISKEYSNIKRMAIIK